MSILVNGYEQSSYNEWPGNITAIIFLSNCNFRCGYCHNRDLVLNKAPTIEFSNIISHLEKRKKWIDAVEITGGEPALHKKEVTEMLKQLKREGFLTKVDTNGADPNFISELNELVDYWAMDVKASLENYSKTVNAKVNIENIKKSIELIKQSKDYEFRTTVVPTLHDKEEIQKIAELIKGAKRYYLQNFAPNNTLDERFMKILPFPEDKLREFAEIVKPFVKEVQIR